MLLVHSIPTNPRSLMCVDNRVEKKARQIGIRSVLGGEALGSLSSWGMGWRKPPPALRRHSLLFGIRFLCGALK